MNAPASPGNTHWFPFDAGVIRISGDARCFGWAIDPHNNLVALNIMGGSTPTRAIVAALQAGKSIQLLYRDQAYNGRTSHTQTGNKWTVITKPIPDTHTKNVVAFAAGFTQSHDKDGRPLPYRYIFNDSVEALHKGFYHTLFHMIDIAIQWEWVPLLIEGGIYSRLAGHIKHDNNIRSLSYGYNLLYMKNEKDRWENLISGMLKNGSIKIGGNQ